MIYTAGKLLETQGEIFTLGLDEILEWFVSPSLSKLAYAGVCSRMLTYAHVCRFVAKFEQAAHVSQVPRRLHTHTHTHTHIYIYVCMYVCMYVCLYHTYVYIYKDICIYIVV